jgi:hypothetical protein
MISKYYIFLVLCFFTPFWLFGNHIIGGHISYTCEGLASPGVNRYRFVMTIYRDCNSGGSDFDLPAQMAIYKGTEQANTLFDDFCISGINNCLNGNFERFRLVPDTPLCSNPLPATCIEVGVYTFTKALPISTTESYFVVYQRCCRNTALTNILNPEEEGFTVAVELNPQSQAGCNASPVFESLPPQYVVLNKPMLVDVSATDADGDSLVYRFCAPLAGGGFLLAPQAVLKSCDGAAPDPPCAPPFDTVAFAAPAFTPQMPMGGNPVIVLQDTSGLLVGTPNKAGQFLIAYCVDEYREQTLLSSTRRELQINVIDCVPLETAGISLKSNGVQIFPNPAKDQILVQWYNEAPTENAVFRLVDVQGRPVLLQPLSDGAKYQDIELPEELRGLYFWTVTADHWVKSGTIVVQ